MSEKGYNICMRKFILLSFLFFIVGRIYSQDDYVKLYLDRKMSIYSLSQEYSSKGRYEELYLILTKILEKTNSFEVLIERIKVGFGLGKDVNEDLLLAFSIDLINSYRYLPIFQSKNLISNFSEFLLSRKESNQSVLYFFSKTCLTYNHVEPLLKLITNVVITNEEILSSLLSKLFLFKMFKDIVNVYDFYSTKIDFDLENTVIVARSMASIGDERCITLLNRDNYYFLPYRIEVLVKLGYIDEAVNEIKYYGISSKSAFFAFISLLNKGEYKLCETSLFYINDLYMRQYLSVILDLLSKGDITNSEKKLKELLGKRGVSLSIKYQIGVILWVINTAENIYEMKKDIIFAFNYLNGIESNYQSERVLERIKYFR